jgi:hypothetical protein
MKARVWVFVSRTLLGVTHNRVPLRHAGEFTQMLDPSVIGLVLTLAGVGEVLGASAHMGHVATVLMANTRLLACQAAL